MFGTDTVRMMADTSTDSRILQELCNKFGANLDEVKKESAQEFSMGIIFHTIITETSEASTVQSSWSDCDDKQEW